MQLRQRLVTCMGVRTLCGWFWVWWWERPTGWHAQGILSHICDSLDKHRLVGNWYCCVIVQGTELAVRLREGKTISMTVCTCTACGGTVYTVESTGQGTENRIRVLNTHHMVKDTACCSGMLYAAKGIKIWEHLSRSCAWIKPNSKVDNFLGVAFDVQQRYHRWQCGQPLSWNTAQ